MVAELLGLDGGVQCAGQGRVLGVSGCDGREFDEGVLHGLHCGPTADRWSKLQLGAASALTEFGHLLGSFVVQEIIRESTWMDDVVTAGHWCTRDNDGVDFVLERQDGAVVSFEMKGQRPCRSEAVVRTTEAP
ncbi:MAG: DUF4143 domain-containing protein [Corynebacterium variabile]|uniref:DUF4143 domain-containing protein n=1 Tax=Corynebacterium variabile TaxID=1727 RepID=UPI003F97F789